MRGKKYIIFKMQLHINVWCINIGRVWLINYTKGYKVRNKRLSGFKGNSDLWIFDCVPKNTERWESNYI